LKEILVLLADGFEEVEALTVVDYLRRKDILVKTCSISKSKIVIGVHDIPVEADLLIDNIRNIEDCNGVIIPGGMPGAENLKNSKAVINTVQKFYKENKLIGAICAGPIVLKEAGIIEGKDITSYPGFEEDLKGGNYKEDLVVRDGNIITARGPAVAVYFALELIEYISGKEKSDELKNDILLNMVERRYQ
jgi:4-methyl-5(b-hydroxyethyl)-thiazole monophosphate biosynthesis